jgi:hypothetical protein
MPTATISLCAFSDVTAGKLVPSNAASVVAPAPATGANVQVAQCSAATQHCMQKEPNVSGTIGHQDPGVHTANTVSTNPTIDLTAESVMDAHLKNGSAPHIQVSVAPKIGCKDAGVGQRIQSFLPTTKIESESQP